VPSDIAAMHVVIALHAWQPISEQQSFAHAMRVAYPVSDTAHSQ